MQADAVGTGVYADAVDISRLQGRRDPRAEFELGNLRLGAVDVALRVLFGAVQGLLRAARQRKRQAEQRGKKYDKNWGAFHRFIIDACIENKDKFMRADAISFALFALVLWGLLPQAPAAPAAGQTPPLRWVFQMHRHSQDDPHTDVFLRVGTRQVLVMRQAPDEFRLAAKTDYKDASVPAQALTACFGWWAGAGDYLYVIRRGRSLVVYRREVDEQAPDFPWKRLIVIPLR